MHTPDRATALLDEAVRIALAAGTLLVLLIPPARGMHEALGWLPLWLVGMPAAAWWALRRGNGEAGAMQPDRAGSALSRRVARRPQALRRGTRLRPAALRRAA